MIILRLFVVVLHFCGDPAPFYSNFASCRGDFEPFSGHFAHICGRVVCLCGDFVSFHGDFTPFVVSY